MKKKLVFSLIIVLALVIVTGCNSKEKEDALKGEWISVVESQEVENNGQKTITVGEEYHLICDGKGYYEIKTDNDNYVSARYSVSKNDVTFYDEGRQVLSKCKLNGTELDCSEKYNYATKYVRTAK